MIQELKRQLKTLSTIPGDPGLPYFRALLQRRAGEDAGAIEREWRNMILVMPDLLERIRRDAAAQAESRVRGLYGFLLTYLYSTTDLIPDEGNGFFGYVDDAYLVTAAHRRIAGMDAIPGSKTWVETVRRIAPHEAAVLDEMLDELLAGRTETYSAVVAS